MTKVKHWLFALFAATVCAALIGALLIPAAYSERGYWAVGGEWLVVIVTWIAVLWTLTGEE